jgi:hypothetical protein
MPLLIVLLTATLGTAIGFWFQNRAFTRNELFRARLERLMRLHTQTVDALQTVDQARRSIRSYENAIYDELASMPEARLDERRRYYAAQNVMDQSLTALKEAKIRLDALAVDVKGLSGDEGASKAIKAYAEESDRFVTCVQQNFAFTRDRTCSEDSPNLVPSLQAVVTAHGTMIDNFVKSYQ